MRPRLVHVIPAMDWGSAETQVALVATHLADVTEPHICTGYIAPELRRELEDRGVTVHVVPHPRAQRTWHRRKLLGVLWSLRPDILHLWRCESSWGASLVAPFVGTSRIVFDHRAPRTIVSEPASLALSAAKAVLGWSLDVVSNRWNHGEFCLCSAGNAPSATALIDDNCRQWLNRLEPPNRWIGIVGWLHRNRRLEDVIWAIDLLKVVRDGVHLVILGDGPDKSRLKRWVDVTLTADRVHFVDSGLAMDRIWQHLSAVVFPGHVAEPPQAMLEAMEYGVPILASPTDSHRALLGDDGRDPQKTSYVPIPVGDRAAIAKGIEYVLDIPEQTQERGQRAKERLRNLDRCIFRLGPNPAAARECRTDTEHALRRFYGRLYGIQTDNREHQQT